MRIFILAVLVACAGATPQYVKSRYSGVKGGNTGHSYNGVNLVRQFNNTQPSYGGYNYRNLTAPVNYEKGVCYVEVPTASLAKDPAHVPAGNGSRPDLSSIRTCCSGYIKNIHNFRICDPVCTKECVNALCTEPETCTCFPDHIKNLAGFCVPTCPIGCQNGQCAGGECICKDGYKLDPESKFCVPICRDNCGGTGNCTAPDVCECRSGYRFSSGSCRPYCDRCTRYGECVAPNECRCLPGYRKDQHGDCVPQCADNCQPNGQCVGVNVCIYPPTTTTTTNPIGHHPQGGHNIPQNPDNFATTRAPTNPGNNPNQQYPGNQQPGYPGYQRPNYPGYQQSNYPGHQQPNYPANQQSQPGQSSQPGHQQPYNPSNQPNYYPGSHPSNYPSNQHPNNPDQQTNNPSGQPNHSGSQPATYPGQIPSNPDRQPIYYNPGGPHGYYNNQRPNSPDSQLPDPNHPSYNPNVPNYPTGQYYQGQYYPGNQQQYPGNQQQYPGNQQQYPDNQHNYPQYPHQQQGYNPSTNSSYSSYTSHQQAQNLYPDNQLANVENLCSKPCINGVCAENGICICNDGYVLDESDPTTARCKPYCPGGCPNGVCSSPNFCICNLGYHKDHSVKGRANCVKRIRRSADAPVNVAELLVFEIPEEEIDL